MDIDLSNSSFIQIGWVCKSCIKLKINESTKDTRNLTSNNKPHQLNMHILLKTNKHAKQAGQVVCRKIWIILL